MPQDRDTDLVRRIVRDILETSPRRLAKLLDIDPEDIDGLYHGRRGQIGAADQEVFFVALANYVDRQLAKLLALRQEIQWKLDADRAARMQRRQRILDR